MNNDIDRLRRVAIWLTILTNLLIVLSLAVWGRHDLTSELAMTLHAAAAIFLLRRPGVFKP